MHEYDLIESFYDFVFPVYDLSEKLDFVVLISCKFMNL